MNHKACISKYWNKCIWSWKKIEHTFSSPRIVLGLIKIIKIPNITFDMLFIEYNIFTLKSYISHHIFLRFPKRNTQQRQPNRTAYIEYINCHTDFNLLFLVWISRFFFFFLDHRSQENCHRIFQFNFFFSHSYSLQFVKRINHNLITNQKGRWGGGDGVEKRDEKERNRR